MSSQIANQTRTVVISWNFVSDDTDVFSKVITVPFLVDEIRVVASGAQLLALAASTTNIDEFGTSVLVSSDDLIGSSGSTLALIKSSSRDTYAAAKTVTGINGAYQQDIRYVFPPSAKRNINGSFRFQLTNFAGGKISNATVNNFSVILVLEFIQYKEVEKQMLDTEDDLRLLGKSGRRRL